MDLGSLNRRERLVLAGGVAFVLIFLVVQFGVLPLLDWRTQIRRQLERAETDLVDLRSLATEYEGLRRRQEVWRQRVSHRPTEFKLLTFINEKAGEAGVKIASMKPSTSKPKDSPYTISRVEVKLEEITLKQLTPLLHLLEASDMMVFIQRLSITKKGEENVVDVVMQVETYES